MSRFSGVGWLGSGEILMDFLLMRLFFMLGSLFFAWPRWVISSLTRLIVTRPSPSPRRQKKKQKSRLHELHLRRGFNRKREIATRKVICECLRIL